MKRLSTSPAKKAPNTADSLLRVTLIFLLVPMMGLRGYLIMFYAGTVFNAALSMWRLIKVSRVRFCLWEWVVKPILGCALACLLTLPLPGLAGGLLMAGSYLLLLWAFGCLTRKDLSWLAAAFR